MRCFCSTFAALALLICVASTASADPRFYTVFKKEYLDNHPDKKYVAEVNKGTNRCLVCHQGKKSRKNHNAFGLPLVDLLDRKKDLKDVEKIAAALKQVTAMHVDPKDDKSETYLDRINASKWPGGDLAELQKEPTELPAAGN